MKYISFLLFFFYSSVLYSGLDTLSIIYSSDRDNIYTNGFAMGFAYDEDYVYPMLDTGNVGIIKIFKIKQSIKKSETVPFVDDSIRWSLYFGDESNFILKDNSFAYILDNGNIRYFVKQKYGNQCKIRLIELSIDGDIINNELLPLVFASDFKCKRISENEFIGIHTIDGENSNVELVKFNSLGELLNNYTISDTEKSLSAERVAVNESGEIAVVSLYPSTECYWRFILTVLNPDFSFKDQFTEDIDIPFRSIILSQSYDKYWLLDLTYLKTSPYKKYEGMQIIFKNDMPYVIYTGYSHPTTYGLFTEYFEPYQNVKFRIGNCYNYLICNLKFDEIQVNYEASTPFYISKAKLYPKYGDKFHIFGNVEMVKPTIYYFSSIFKNFSIRKLDLQYTHTSIEDEVMIESELGSYFFSGDFARLKVSSISTDATKVYIYDSMGNKIDEIHTYVGDTYIDLPIYSLSNGIYFYHIPQLNIKGKFGVIK